MRRSLNGRKVVRESTSLLTKRVSARSSLHRRTPPPVRRVRNDVNSRDVTLLKFQVKSSTRGSGWFAWSMLNLPGPEKVQWRPPGITPLMRCGHRWQYVTSKDESFKALPAHMGQCCHRWQICDWTLVSPARMVDTWPMMTFIGSTVVLHWGVPRLERIKNK